MTEQQIHDAICGKVNVKEGKTCADPAGHILRLYAHVPRLFEQ